MQYLLMIYANEAEQSAMAPEAFGQMVAEYNAFTKALKEAGAFVGGDALQPTRNATTVRVRNGKTVHTDGPFAETKEQVGGYYLIEVKDLDEALAWAAKIPDAREGGIEVRPIMVVPGG